MNKQRATRPNVNPVDRAVRPATSPARQLTCQWSGRQCRWRAID